jgi:hypothetical protein
MKYIIVAILAGLCYSCNMVDDDKQLWQTDVNGCKGRRTKELGEKLVSDNHLKGSSNDEFAKVFGTPDRLLNYKGRHIIIYLFNCTCAGGQVVAENDKCYAEYTFVNNKLVSESYICE